MGSGTRVGPTVQRILTTGHPFRYSTCGPLRREPKRARDSLLQSVRCLADRFADTAL